MSRLGGRRLSQDFLLAGRSWQAPALLMSHVEGASRFASAGEELKLRKLSNGGLSYVYGRKIRITY